MASHCFYIRKWPRSHGFTVSSESEPICHSRTQWLRTLRQITIVQHIDYEHVLNNIKNWPHIFRITPCIPWWMGAPRNLKSPFFCCLQLWLVTHIENTLCFHYGLQPFWKVDHRAGWAGLAGVLLRAHGFGLALIHSLWHEEEPFCLKTASHAKWTHPYWNRPAYGQIAQEYDSDQWRGYTLLKPLQLTSHTTLDQKIGLFNSPMICNEILSDQMCT